MKIQILAVLLLCILTSCAPGTSFPVSEPLTLSPSENFPAIKHTLTPVLNPTVAGKSSAQTPNPTPTNPSTSSPLPALTPYPTFEIIDVKTQPPFPPAQCPATDPGHEITFDMAEITSGSGFWSVARKAIDEGASFDQVMKVYLETPLSHDVDELKMMDLTGDGVPELVIKQVFNLVVIGCEKGRYATLLDFNPTHDRLPFLVAVQDMNLNGIPDIVLTYAVTSGSNAVVDILEWNGSEFKSLILANHGVNSVSTSRLAKALYWYSQQGSRNWSEDPDVNTPTMNGSAKIAIRDVDNNGTKELTQTPNPNPL